MTQMHYFTTIFNFLAVLPLVTLIVIVPLFFPFIVSLFFFKDTTAIFFCFFDNFANFILDDEGVTLTVTFKDFFFFKLTFVIVFFLEFKNFITGFSFLIW